MHFLSFTASILLMTAVAVNAADDEDFQCESSRPIGLCCTSKLSPDDVKPVMACQSANGTSTYFDCNGLPRKGETCCGKTTMNADDQTLYDGTNCELGYPDVFGGGA